MRIRSLSSYAICILLAVFAAYSQAQLQVGYATLAADPGSLRPTGTALFTYTNDSGVVLWQAGVAAVEPIRSGRVFVERSGATRSALALVNPSDTAVSAKLVLRDDNGVQIGIKTRDLAPREHLSKFVEELIGHLVSHALGDALLPEIGDLEVGGFVLERF